MIGVERDRNRQTGRERGVCILIVSGDIFGAVVTNWKQDGVSEKDDDDDDDEIARPEAVKARYLCLH